MMSDWRNSLPFMARDAVVERMAVVHHQSTLDPLVQLISGQRDMTWLEIFNVGHTALREVGAEIALASTEAHAATAALRRTTIMEGLATAEAAMLDIAEKLLAQGIKIHDPDNVTGLVAYGHAKVEGPLKSIAASHWKAGQIDWKSSRVSVEGEADWFGVQVVDVSLLETDVLLKVLADAGITGSLDE